MTGVLIVNIGTPKSTSREDVGQYLREFLMDEEVIDVPFIFRWPLVNWLIVPKRSIATAELYKNIWQPEGSPLLTICLAQKRALQKVLGPEFPVELGMRYGEPSLLKGIESMKARGVKRVILVPMYPQYSTAATRSSVNAVKNGFGKIGFQPQLQIIEDFYSDEGFIEVSARRVSEAKSRESLDYILFSFHGLPERQIKKTCDGCLATANCCADMNKNNKYCYRAQSFETARLIARKLELRPESFSVSFQSRLGRSRWIFPHTDVVIQELAKKGIRRLGIYSPSFTADCLETLEENGIRNRATFKSAGGQELISIPAANDDENWIGSLAKMVADLNR